MKINKMAEELLALKKRIWQLECGHPIRHRVFGCHMWEVYFEKCDDCGKTIRSTYTVSEYKQWLQEAADKL